MPKELADLVEGPAIDRLRVEVEEVLDPEIVDGVGHGVSPRSLSPIDMLEPEIRALASNPESWTTPSVLPEAAQDRYVEVLRGFGPVEALDLDAAHNAFVSRPEAVAKILNAIHTRS